MDRPCHTGSIDEHLKKGQEVMVQITKEPIGTKGARVTSYITLPGRYLVYMPTVDHVGISRRIEAESERIRREAELTPEEPPKPEARIESIESSVPYRLLTSGWKRSAGFLITMKRR